MVPPNLRKSWRILATSAFLACGPKSTNQESSDSGSSTGESEGAWAVGYYFRPGGGSPTATLATLDVKSDRTAILYTEACFSSEPYTGTLAWEPVDADSIVFVAIDGSGPAFGRAPLPEGVSVTLSRTDEDKIVQVSRGDTVEDDIFGDYWRASAPVCLVLEDPVGGCDNGTYVKSCSE